MSTAFETGFNDGDLIEPEHVLQFAQPINDLESGRAHFRVATDDSGDYQVDFQASQNPSSHFLSTLAQGQVIAFKASHNSAANAQLKVVMEGSTVTHPLFTSGTAIGANEIVADEIVIATFNDTTTPRFDVIGGGGGALSDLSDAQVTSPTTGETLRFDGTKFVNDNLEIADVNGLAGALASAGGSPTGILAQFDALTLSQGDLITVDSNGDLIQLALGTEGHVLQVTGGMPAWGESVGGGDLLKAGLVAYGYRYAEITSTSQSLKSSAFTPVNGATYLIRYLSNHSTSVGTLNLTGARSAGQDHFCRANETGSSTVYNIGFSSSNPFDYTFTVNQRCRPIDFLWTASTSNEVEIEMGQPTLSYGEFTGTIMVYKLQPNIINLGWGLFGSSYRWLEDPSNTTNSLSGGSYRTGVSLDASKTYAFYGYWSEGYSVKLVLRQGTSYWVLPANSDTWSSASAGDNIWSGGIYYESTSSTLKGETLRFFSPPSTGTFDVGCGFYGIQQGMFLLIEVP